MFRILSTHASTEVLDPATKVVEKAHAVRSTALDMALYESAKIFVVNAPKTKGDEDDVVKDSKTGSSDDRNTSPASNDALATNRRQFSGVTSEVGVFERFQPLVMAVLAAPLEPWRQPERARKSRVELALALGQRGLQDPAALAAILDPWLAEERSRPLREDIERARQACKRDL